VGGLVSAQSVDREELESQITGSVEFQNYEGPYETVQTAGEIRGIGADLGQISLTPGSSRTFAGKYRVIHAVGPESEEGLDADIFILLEEANVDHIDNVRRIVGAYLESAYAYSSDDASVLAEFVTVYNALHRGDLPFYQNRYKQVVIDNLSEESVGISTLYSDWPGNTQMVIPLSAGARPGEIGAIDPLALTDPSLIEQLRMREDMGIAQRKALVDILERAIEEEREQIEEEQAAIDEQQEELAQQEEALQEEQAQEDGADGEPTEEEQPQQEPAQEDQDDQAAEEDEAPAEEDEEPTPEEQQDEQLTQEEIDEQQEELEQQEEELEEREQRVEDMEDEVQEQRDQIAEDQQQQIDEEQEQQTEAAQQEAPAPVVFLRVREQGDEQLRQFVLVNPGSGEVVQESELAEITSPAAERYQNELVVVARQEGEPRLLLVDQSNLEILRSGEEPVFETSVLRVGPQGEQLYAVVRQESSWYLGRFNRELALQERSSVAVNPHTSLSFSEGALLVQLPDGRIAPLSLEDMSAQE
jgi:hypothetical protein